MAKADALRFACNAINVGRTIMLNEISNHLRDRLAALGFRVVQVELSEFLKAGGAAKCLALRLSEVDVTHTSARVAPGSDEAHLHRSGVVRYNSMYEENRIHVAPRLPGLGSFLGG